MRKAGTGKGVLTANPKGAKLWVSLAFFLIFISFSLIAPDCPAQQRPVISSIAPNRDDIVLKQFLEDVEKNNVRLRGMRANFAAAADDLRIYQYTVQPGDNFSELNRIIPYWAVSSLNRIHHQSALTAGMVILLPSCRGIFVPSDPMSDMELIVAAGRLNEENSFEFNIPVNGIQQAYRFFPGAEYTQTERLFFTSQERFKIPLRNYRLTSSYGLRPDPFTGRQQMHRGIDFAAAEGTEVYAAAGGIVEEISYSPVYGNYIKIKHRNNLTSFYAHLQKVETALLSEVKSTTLIGRVGSTGQSTGPHLHFELLQDGKHIDPGGRLRS